MAIGLRITRAMLAKGARQWLADYRAGKKSHQHVDPERLLELMKLAREAEPPAEPAGADRPES